MTKTRALSPKIDRGPAKEFANNKRSSFEIGLLSDNTPISRTRNFGYRYDFRRQLRHGFEVFAFKHLVEPQLVLVSSYFLGLM